MDKIARTTCFRRSLLWFSTSALAFVCILGTAPRMARAQNAGNGDPTQSVNWAAGAIAHSQQMRRFKDADQGSQPTPPIIPKFEIDGDPSGSVATFQPNGATITSNNPFFQNLGTNGRTCFTCHQPQTGWTVSAASVRARFAASVGSDPIFRLVDGATCPTDDVSTLAAKQRAYKLLNDKGLIRIGIAMPDPVQFSVTNVVDPYNCTKNPATGLTSPTTGILSMYRRPLPSANLGFLTAIMWDGREPSLAHQSLDATLGHAQATVPLSPDQQAAIVAFETGLFTAQVFDNQAHVLHADGATGGPIALSLQKFFTGINDPLGNNPTGATFDPNIFDLYRPWLGLRGMSGETAYRQSIARGEEVFNTAQITVTGVAGLNDLPGLSKVMGVCGTCHDAPNVGNHSVRLPLNIGIADAGAKKPPALDIDGLPVFTLQCNQGPLAGQTFVVTDPGRALITGNCADIGKVKGPVLRALAARAPYFHNGSAATLLDVINFYDQRFNIGFTQQQKQDLVNFLNSL
jgi:cytochrome c peroxidase